MVDKRCSRCRGTKSEQHFKNSAGKPRETCNDCRAKDVKKRTKARQLAREQRAKDEAAGTSTGEAPPPMSNGVSAFSLADPFGPAPSPSPPPQPRTARKIKFKHLPPQPVVPPAPGHVHYNVSPHMPPPPGHMLIAHQVAAPALVREEVRREVVVQRRYVEPEPRGASGGAASWGTLFAQAPEEKDMISNAVKLALAGSGVVVGTKTGSGNGNGAVVKGRVSKKKA